MRARNIKPSFFTNETFGTEDPIVGLCFIGLWCLADKDGILEDRPLRIKAELFPYRDKTDINGYLTVMERTGHILRYEVDGNRYIKVINFEKHQHPHHTEKAKGFPQPPDVKCEQPLTPLSNGYTPSDSLIPDSLIPDKKALSGKPDDSKKLAIELLEFLNLKSGKNFHAVDANIKMIQARLREYPMQDLKSMIALKCRAWRNDEVMVQYIRPGTLFNATKCAQYVGELIRENENGA